MTTIIRSKSGLKTKLKNLVLFPTGLAIADELFVRQVSHLHAYWLSGPSTVGLIASQVAGVHWSYTAHSWDIFVEDNLIAAKTRSAAFGRVISELGRQGILRRSSGSEDRTLQVIHLGVHMPPRPAPTRAGPQIRLLCPAYLVAVKGHAYLLQALRFVVDAGIDCHCVFAGDGPLRASLFEQVRHLGLETVVSMPGMVRHEELLQQLSYGKYDAVVLASVELGNEFEGIPVSLIEAMAAGVPCIATRTGAIAELIDTTCGMLVNQRDPRAMSEAIIALAKDPAGREELGHRAMGRVAEQFNSAHSARRLLRLIEDAKVR